MAVANLVLALPAVWPLRRDMEVLAAGAHSGRPSRSAVQAEADTARLTAPRGFFGGEQQPMGLRIAFALARLAVRPGMTTWWR